MQRHKTAGISIPAELMQRIDNERGDISRSRFVLRLLATGFAVGFMKGWWDGKCGSNYARFQYLLG